VEAFHREAMRDAAAGAAIRLGNAVHGVPLSCDDVVAWAKQTKYTQIITMEVHIGPDREELSRLR
jgi:hypothetical protein